MTDRIDEFLTNLGTTPQPQLLGLEATLRIDIEDGDQVRHWLLTIANGRIRISRRAGRADAIICGSASLFEHLIVGEANPLTAALRGDVYVEGDARLLVAFKSLLPGPPSRQTMVPTDGSRRRSDRTAVAAARRSSNRSVTASVSTGRARARKATTRRAATPTSRKDRAR